MLKIGLVTGEFPPLEGGVGAFTQALARALAIEGHQIHIITSRDARPDSAPRRPGAVREPIELDYAFLHPRIGRWRWPSLATIADICLRAELDVVNIQYQAAAYNMHSAAINFAPWRLKGLTKTAVTFHDLRIPYLFPKAGRLRRAAVNFMARQAHGVIVTNPADYQSLISNLQSPIIQIPIGSNIATYPYDEDRITAVRRDLGLDEDAVLLGYFGFLNASKGADTLLQALAKLDGRFHLVFIGGQTGASDSANNQAFLDHLKAQIAGLGLAERVHWTGFLADAQVSAHLYTADLIVMPYQDGASLRRGTLMAALAHGRPLITTEPATPTPELVHGQNAWFVPTDEHTALAEAICSLTNETELRHKLGHGAAHIADAFTWDKIAAKTAEFFQRL